MQNVIFRRYESCMGEYVAQVPFSESESLIRSVKGGHRFKVSCFSSYDKSPAANIASAPFMLAGREWQLVCYPGGETEEVAGFLSLFLGYRGGPEECCRAAWLLRCVNQYDGETSRERKWCKGDKYNHFNIGRRWGWQKFMKLDSLLDPAKGFLKDDCLIFEAELTVHMSSETIILQDKPNAPLASEMSNELLRMYNSGIMTDVCFKFEGEGISLKAHSQILAARSPVLERMFAGGFCEKSKGSDVVVVNISDVESGVFDVFLYFLYGDKLPEDVFTKTTKTIEDFSPDSGSSKKRKKEVVNQVNQFDIATKLFQTADKYEVNRLRQVCEYMLCEFIEPDTVIDLLLLSDSHAAVILKDKCIKFLCVHRDHVDKIRLPQNILVDLFDAIQSSSKVDVFGLEKPSGRTKSNSVYSVASSLN